MLSGNHQAGLNWVQTQSHWSLGRRSRTSPLYSLSLDFPICHRTKSHLTRFYVWSEWIKCQAQRPCPSMVSFLPCFTQGRVVGTNSHSHNLFTAWSTRKFWNVKAGSHLGILIVQIKSNSTSSFKKKGNQGPERWLFFWGQFMAIVIWPTDNIPFEANKLFTLAREAYS